MLFRTAITGLLLSAGAFAQFPTFPKPAYFRQTFQDVQTKVELKDPARLRDFVIDGKLELSLKNYLELVMANNTGIQISMLSLEQPKNAIQRAFTAWDPTAQASFSSRRSKSVPQGVLDGATNISSSLSQPFSASVRGTLDTGTTYNFGFDASKSASNSSLNNFNPSFSSNLAVNLTQPLLRGRGRYINRLTLMMARSSLRISEFNLRNTLINTIQQAEAAYWAAVEARERLRVSELARDTSSKYLEYVQRQLDLGAISHLDIYNPKQNLARAEVTVSNNRFNLLQAEDALRTQIAADLDPEIRKLPLVLTETIEIPNSDALTYDPEPTIARALANRPDLKATVQRLDNDDLSIAQAKNSLLPQLNMTGSYSTQGRGGVFYQRQNVFNDGLQSTVTTVIPGGLGDSLNQMFGFGYPVYSVGLTLSLPLRNRDAQVNLANSLVQKKTDSLELRRSQQNIRLSVLNAITAFNGAKEGLKLAQTSAEFAQLNMDAMNTKYELGTETPINVTNTQQALAEAQLSVVNAQISMRRAMTNLLRETGELLDQRGIVVQIP